MGRYNLVRWEVPAVHGEGGGPGLQDLLTHDGALSSSLQPVSQSYSILRLAKSSVLEVTFFSSLYPSSFLRLHLPKLEEDNTNL